MLINACLFGLLGVAIIYDFKERRIPNLLVLTGLAAAAFCHLHTEGIVGLLFSLKGLVTGILLLLIPFIMRGIGAGDVKLLGAVGAFKGSVFVFNTFLWMALWGGIIAAVIMLFRKQLGKTLRRLFWRAFFARLGITGPSDSFNEDSGILYPYAAAIGLGVLTSYLYGGWWS
ncbi:MAG: prepilin peptidase [Syntrophomonadaceae bacterium]|nr:prepilin peptidase [Syntrophomonadaceae bacterium]